MRNIRFYSKYLKNSLRFYQRLISISKIRFFKKESNMYTSLISSKNNARTHRIRTISGIDIDNPKLVEFGSTGNG
jgi:hypothetical protein